MKLQFAVPAVHAAWGTALAYRPGTALTAVGGPAASPRERLVLRLLGARHLGQAAVTAAVPTPGVLAAGSAVDLLHAASCLALALAGPRWRRAGGLGCLSASAFAVAGLTVAWQAARTAEDAG